MVGLGVALPCFESITLLLPSSFVSFSFTYLLVGAHCHLWPISPRSPGITHRLPVVWGPQPPPPHIHPSSSCFLLPVPLILFSYQPPSTLRHFFFVPNVLPISLDPSSTLQTHFPLLFQFSLTCLVSSSSTISFSFLCVRIHILLEANCSQLVIFLRVCVVFCLPVSAHACLVSKETSPETDLRVMGNGNWIQILSKSSPFSVN